MRGSKGQVCGDIAAIPAVGGDRGPPDAATWLRDVAGWISRNCGDEMLRHLLEEEWRGATKRIAGGGPMPLADIEALIICLVERVRQDYGGKTLIRLLDDARALGEMREAVDNRRGH